MISSTGYPDKQLDQDVEIILTRLSWLLTHIAWVERLAILAIIALTITHFACYEPQQLPDSQPTTTFISTTVTQRG